MERFHYKAKRGLNEVVEDFIEAPTQEDALNLLSARGLFPVLIERAAQVALPPDEKPRLAGAAPAPAPSLLKLTPRDRMLFTRKLATLIHARVELLSALKILFEQAEGAHLRQLVQLLFNSIKEGHSFSESLGRFPGFFDPFYVNMIRAGETSGRLDLSLEQVSAFLEKEERLKTKVLTALAYPVLLICVGAVSLAVLIVFVIPKLSPVLKGIGRLPLATRWLLAVSEVAHRYWLPMALLLAGSVLAVIAQRRNPFFAAAAVKVKKAVPIVRDLVRNQGLANFSWSLSLLIRSGVPIYQALRVSAQIISDREIGKRLEQVCEQLRQGQTLSRSLEQQNALPPFFVKMLAIGEESGKLPDVLQQISDSYAQEVETSITVLSSLLEPVLILGLGSVLGLIVFSLMLPLFEITQTIR
jgi:type II secretory pathway component PulF